MKTVAIGDIHGRKVWKKIVERENPDRVVFVGDYFDSYEFTALEQMSNFQEIIEFKKSGECEVVLLVGNHDHHYFPGIDGSNISGFQARACSSISYLIYENKEHLQIAFETENFVFSHAGISQVFMDETFGKDGWDRENMVLLLNQKFKYQPKYFCFLSGSGFTNPYGDDPFQGPLWIRPRSLMRANKNTLRKQIIQVVGHTQMNKIDTGKTTGGRYWFIDTLGTSGEYLIIKDQNIWPVNI